MSQVHFPFVSSGLIMSLHTTPHSSVIINLWLFSTVCLLSHLYHQPVAADDCQRFLPVKRAFFHPTVAKSLLKGGCSDYWGFFLLQGLDLTI